MSNQSAIHLLLVQHPPVIKILLRRISYKLAGKPETALCTQTLFLLFIIIKSMYVCICRTARVAMQLPVARYM